MFEFIVSFKRYRIPLRSMLFFMIHIRYQTLNYFGRCYEVFDGYARVQGKPL